MTFLVSQPWPGKGANTGSSFFSTNRDGIESLEICVFFGHPVVWCKANGTDRYYPFHTVSSFERAD